VRDVIYAGLTDLNTGFDSPLICHFSPEDFLTMIDAVSRRTWCLPGRWGCCRSKSLPKTGTTGRADWSGITRKGPTSPSVRASMCPMSFSSRTDLQVYKGQCGNPTARAPAATAFRSVGNSVITTPVRMIARLHNRLQIVIRSKKMSAEPRPYICACTPGTVPPSIASVVYSLTESRSPHKWRDCKSRCSRIAIFPHYASCISDRSFPSWRCFS
jgi:hypothetical protein